MQKVHFVEFSVLVFFLWLITCSLVCTCLSSAQLLIFASFSLSSPQLFSLAEYVPFVFPLPSPVGYGPEADAVNAGNEIWVVSSFAFMLKFDPYSVIRTAEFPDESLDVRPVTISVFGV